MTKKRESLFSGMEMYGDIDKGIKPLIDAMNRHEWLHTLSSCEGHEEHEFNDMPYVALACKMSKINKLIEILQVIDVEIETSDKLININLSFVYSQSVYGSQDDMPKGWISLNIKIELYEDDYEEAKKFVLNRLTELFEDAEKQLQIVAN